MVKYIIFDAGAVINITENCLVSMLRDLSKVFQGEFIITPEVEYETIEHPMKIKRFEWGAVRIKSLLEEEILKPLAEEELVSEKELNEKTNKVMQLANTAFSVNGKPIHLIERGESECLALSMLLAEKNIESVVAIDERTARMLCENPDYLKKLMSNKLETNVEMDEEKLKNFEKVKVIRSAELCYMAFKKGLINGDRKKLEAMLYALKFGGCSISEKEIQAISRM